jgi:hypothetical protein
MKPSPSSGSDHTDGGLSVGDRVRSAEWVKPPEYANRTGTIVGFADNEVAVSLGSASSNTPAIWFRAQELEVGGRPSKAPGKAAGGAGGSLEQTPTPRPHREVGG